MAEEDQRSSKRLHKRFILRAAVFGEQPLRWSHVTIHNLSSTGTLFTFDKPVHLGALLHFKIDFPDRVIECMGRVRRLIGGKGTLSSVGASFEGVRPHESEDLVLND